jgi:hypothetical protein
MTTQTFIIYTGAGYTTEIDTIISGADAAGHAMRHKEMLEDEFFSKGAVKVIGVEGTKSGWLAELIADEMREGKPFGRKAFRRWEDKAVELTGSLHKVNLARFNRVVTATIAASKG